jgi:hypothetical protein
MQKDALCVGLAHGLQNIAGDRFGAEVPAHVVQRSAGDTVARIVIKDRMDARAPHALFDQRLGQ